MEERPYPYKGSIGSTVAGAIIGWAIPKLLDFIWPQWFAPLAALPIETGFLGAITAFLGFTAGLHVGRHSPAKPRRMTRKEKRELQEQDKERAKRSCNDAADALMQLAPDDRALFVVLASGKTAYSKGEDWRCSFSASDEFFAQFLEVRYMDGDIAKITPKLLLEHLFSERPELKEGLSATINKHRRKTVHDDIYATTFSGDQLLPYWWWTT